MTGRKLMAVGGGAAGLIAAGQAAQLGTEMRLIEKMIRLGCSLRITGGYDLQTAFSACWLAGRTSRRQGNRNRVKESERDSEREKQA